MRNDNKQANESSNELRLDTLPLDVIFLIMLALNDTKEILNCRLIARLFENLIHSNNQLQRIINGGKEKKFHDLRKLYANKLSTIKFSPTLFSEQHKNLKAIVTNAKALTHHKKTLEKLKNQKEKYKRASSFGGAISAVLFLLCFLIKGYDTSIELLTSTNSTSTESAETITNNDINANTFTQDIFVALGLLGFIISGCFSCFSGYKYLRASCTEIAISNNEDVEQGLIKRFPSQDDSSPRAPLLTSNSPD